MLSTPGHPGLHLLQLQLSRQSAFSVESPKISRLPLTPPSASCQGTHCIENFPAHAHLNNSSLAWAPSAQNIQGPDVAHSPCWDPHQPPAETSLNIEFSNALFTSTSTSAILPRCPFCIEPQDSPRLHPLQLQLFLQGALFI